MNQNIKIGDTNLDLDSGTVISTTRRIANIGTLERQSSFTNKLNIPSTANNLAAIGMVQGSDDSTKKYIKQTGSVLANGIEIMNAAQFTFESLGDRIELLINSDNATFFDLIKQTFLRELDMSALDHKWTMSTMISSISNTYPDGYVYALHDSGVQSQITTRLNTFGIVPSVFVKYIFEKIGETFGYTFTGSIYNESYFESLLIPAISCKTGTRNIEELQCSLIMNVPVDLTGGQTWLPTTFFTDWLAVKKLDGSAFTDKWGVARLNEGYFLQIPGQYEFTLDFQADLQPAAPGLLVYGAFKIIVYQTLNQVTSVLGETVISSTTAGSFNGQIKLNVIYDAFMQNTPNPSISGSSEINSVYAEVQVFKGNVATTQTNFEIIYLKLSASKITNAFKSHYNRLFNIQENLPAWTCAKFVKEISNLFGIIPIVNEYDKQIRLVTFNEINAAKIIAKEWQNKIDLANDPIYTFKVDGYGQKNNFRYLPDPTFDYSINILNESLPKDVDYIKSEFNYSRLQQIQQKDFNTIFLDNYDSSVSISSSIVYTDRMKFSGKARIAFLFRKNTQIKYISFNENITIINGNIPFLGFEFQSFQTFNLEWQYLYETFYKNLFEGLTNNILKVELNFRLTEFDIQEFDFSIPVYLENPSGYYYVQEIKDFTSSSESTSVELLRIG
jgi:hypothetical protein